MGHFIRAYASVDVYFVEVQERRKRRLYRIYRIISGIISVLLVEIHDDNDEEINLLYIVCYSPAVTQGATKQKMRKCHRCSSSLARRRRGLTTHYLIRKISLLMIGNHACN